MISVIASGRSVAVVRLIPGVRKLTYKSAKSSMMPIEIGEVPKDHGAVRSLDSRNPPFRRPYVVVEFVNDAVFVAQLQARKTKLGEWIRVF